MGVYAALDVSQEQTAICVIDDGGTLLAEGKVATCPDAIAIWLGRWTGALSQLGGAGAYLGLTPRRYESGEISRNSGISKRGDRMTEPISTRPPTPS